MTLTIELTPEEEARLQEEAHEAGLAPADYVHRLIEEDLAVLPQNPTNAQIVEYWKQSGVLGVFSDRGPEFARQLRAKAWRGRDSKDTLPSGESAPMSGVYARKRPKSGDDSENAWIGSTSPLVAATSGRFQSIRRRRGAWSQRLREQQAHGNTQ